MDIVTKELFRDTPDRSPSLFSTGCLSRSPSATSLDISITSVQVYLKKKNQCKLTTVDPQERSTWRSGVRSAMRAASQLPGKGPTDVDDAPAPAG